MWPGPFFYMSVFFLTQPDLVKWSFIILSMTKNLIFFPPACHNYELTIITPGVTFDNTIIREHILPGPLH